MKCLQCDTLFEPKRKTAQFCSSYCRVKYNRSKAAEDGDPSVVWDGSECNTNAEEPPKPRKPSTSHVVLLKQRVKERILGKAEGHSTTPCASSDAVDSDVPPAFDPMVNVLHPEKWNDQDSAHWQKVGEETIDSLRKQSEHLEDATAGLPVDALPSKITQTQLKELRDKLVEDEKTNSHLPLAYWGGHNLPVEDSTAINQQAKAVISKVPTCKPGSELARLENSQLKGKKAQPKGGES